MDYKTIDEYITNNLDQSIQELCELVSQPSISARLEGLEYCSQLVAQALSKRGFEIQIFQTANAPIIFAERKGRVDKTLLIYNHYDVVPPEPLDLWDTPPFEPVLRDGKIYGRGVSDDKGHFTYRLHAIDAILASDGDLPCNIKWIIEGEEETDNIGLDKFVKENTTLLKADACVWEYGIVDDDDLPVETLGLRGIQLVELRVRTANQDVHSGLGGSIFPNAAWKLVWALDSIKSQDENVKIAGFYNKVLPVPYRTRALLEKLPDPGPAYKERYEVKEFLNGISGGADLRLAEAHKPTCSICGFSSGYDRDGAKTIIPAEARVKLDFRLVPNQDPAEILELLRAHLDKNGFHDIEMIDQGGEKPALTDPDDPFVVKVVRCAEDVYGVPMKILPSAGGSGPNAIVQELLQIPIVSAGAGYPGTYMHAPNENMRLDLYLLAAKHFARILKVFSGEDKRFG